MTVANIKSAKKRIKTSEKKAERNKAIRSGVKTSIKKLQTAIESGDNSVAGEALKGAISTLEKAGSKGVYHKDNVSRKVSRLTKAVNKMA
ncbi:MAG: 30S ribosomal protein S20 [Lachnospiraceae bacterium]|nr:30S ribosomal protein S20 [Lachnospiraceae bacterium]